MFLSAGLTWQDDTTQQVLSKELSKLRRLPYRPQQSGPVYNSNIRSDVPLLGSSLVLLCCSATMGHRILSDPYRLRQNVNGCSSPSLRVVNRPVAEAMDPVDQRVKPVEVELSRNLQSYLQRLGLLPKTLTSASLSGPGKVREFRELTLHLWVSVLYFLSWGWFCFCRIF